jgi:hypothetical protein
MTSVSNYRSQLYDNGLQYNCGITSKPRRRIISVSRQFTNALINIISIIIVIIKLWIDWITFWKVSTKSVQALSLRFLAITDLMTEWNFKNIIAIFDEVRSYIRVNFAYKCDINHELNNEFFLLASPYTQKLLHKIYRLSFYRECLGMLHCQW